MILKRSLPMLLVVVCLLLTTGIAEAQENLLHRSEPGPRATSLPQSRRTQIAAQTTPKTTTTENGLSCTTITFEGVGNTSGIPDFDGISSPGWLGLIDEDAGGSGNFAFEPSPQTIAFWLGGAAGSRDIVFQKPVSKVEFFYSSFVTVRLEALDSAGNIIASAVGGANHGQGPGGDPTGTFNKWDPLRVEIAENKIVRVRVSGNVNQTGIDNLKVCRAVGIHSVEITQAIQEWQELSELKTDLQGDREPPVPIVKGKPGVLRVYINQLQEVTDVRVQVSGVTNQTKSMTVQPQCTPELQRRGENGCRSLDFYFTPPDGDWEATIKLFDSNNSEVESNNLPLSSRDADDLVLRSVSICDARDNAGNWLCAPASSLGGLIDFLRRTAPTDVVRVSATNHVVRRDSAVYDTDGDGAFNDTEETNWWTDTIREVHNDFDLFDSLLTLFGEQRYYYGMIRPQLLGTTGGMAHNIPSRGAGSRSSAIRLGTETAQEVIAHETGHMLGRRHTNTQAPGAVGNAPPGCYHFAADSSTDWPFANNRIQSNRGLEVGFDVSARRPLRPETTFDWMGYCTPRWISPFTYTRAMTALGATNAPITTRPTTTPAASVGAFWTVSGLIIGDTARLDPVFEMETLGPTDTGSGPYRIEVRNAADDVIFTRFFTPKTTAAESPGNDLVGPPAFFELLPVDNSATGLVVINPSGDEIGQLQLDGASPTVAITAPVGGSTVSGVQDVTWSITDPDSSVHTSRVFYSADDGSSWSLIGQVNAKSLKVDFDNLPGSTTARLMIAASDGANTGTAQSAIFRVTKKLPTAEIIFPQANNVFQFQELVWLRGSAFDMDDGFLDGNSVRWESDRDGALGTGASLPITTLTRGAHRITMTATDSDANAASRSVDITVAGDGPTLDLTVTPLSVLPTTCVQVDIDARAGSVDLATVEYSLDAGATWTPVSLNSLPFRFIVPGQGFFHLVTRAIDIAGQTVAKDNKFFIDSPCTNINTPPVANAGPDQTVECAGALTAVTLNGAGSSDPDGDALTYEWFEGAQPLGTGAILQVNLARGLHVITLIVTDPSGASSSDTVNVAVVDTTPPVLSNVSVTPQSLWPPNHDMNDVVVSYTVTDACCATSTTLSVTSNEPINGTGDGDTAPDWEIVDEHHVRLRAERSGTGNGRIYTITITSTDCAGNSTSKAVTVRVAKSQGG